MWISVTSIFLPVGGMPMNGPSWVPVSVQRNTTVSPSAMTSSTSWRLSGKAAVTIRTVPFISSGPNGMGTRPVS